MVKKLYTESYIEDIADAIREKNGSSDTYTTAQMGPAIRAIPTGGGSAEVVNGVIEYFKAKSGTISANTFVEFVNGGLADGITPIGGTGVTTASNSDYYIHATALSENAVFIASGSGSAIYAAVCTISGATVTAGEVVQLATGSYLHYALNLLTLDAERVLVTYKDPTYNRVSGLVCAISGTTITSGTSVAMGFDCYSVDYRPSLALLGQDKVFAVGAGDYNDQERLSGAVYTVSGSVITKESQIQLSTGSSSYQEVSVVALDSSSVFISHRSGSYLYGLVCTISGTTITAGTDTQLSNVSSSYSYAKTVALDSSTAFVAHRSGSYLYGLVCTISGTTITAGTDTQLSTLTNSYQYAEVQILGNTGVFIAYRSGGNLYTQVVTISGTTITAGTENITIPAISPQEQPVSLVVLSESTALIAFSNGRKVSAYLFSGGVTIQASTTKIEGLTKTEATTSTAGDVWVLNV